MNIKDKIIQDITNQIDKQNEKGFEKYGETIDQARDNGHNWQNMLNEELIDGLQYANKEIKRLNEQNEVLSSRLIKVQNFCSQLLARYEDEMVKESEKL